METQAEPISATVMADPWRRVEEPGHAIDWLARAADQRLFRVVFLAVDPDYDLLRAEPRFAKLLTRLRLPVASV